MFIAKFCYNKGAIFGIIVNYRQWNTRFSSLIMAALLVQKIYSEPKINELTARNIFNRKYIW